MIAIICLDQLCGDAYLVAVFAYTALEYMGYFQSGGYFWYFEVFVLERERRSACRHFQFRNSCKHIQQFLGDTIREIFLLRVVGHIDEWQYGDGMV